MPRAFWFRFVDRNGGPCRRGTMTCSPSRAGCSSSIASSSIAPARPSPARPIRALPIRARPSSRPLRPRRRSRQARTRPTVRHDQRRPAASAGRSRNRFVARPPAGPGASRGRRPGRSGCSSSARPGHRPSAERERPPIRVRPRSGRLRRPVTMVHSGASEAGASDALAQPFDGAGSSDIGAAFTDISTAARQSSLIVGTRPARPCSAPSIFRRSARATTTCSSWRATSRRASSFRAWPSGSIRSSLSAGKRL